MSKINGILREAGFDSRGHFKAAIEVGPDKVWSRDVEVVGEQTKCIQFIDKRITADEIPQTTNPKYNQIVNVRLVEQAPATTPKSAPLPHNRRFSDDEIGLQKARCSIVSSVCNLYSGNKTVTIDVMLTAAKAFEKYIYEPSLINEAIKMGAIPDGDLPF